MLCKLGAPELLMLSNGLPPPLLVLPDFIDCASAGDVLVLLADVDFACAADADEVWGGGVLVTDDEGADVCCVVESVVLCFIDAEDVAVLELVEAGFVEDKAIVLIPIDIDDGIGIKGMVVAAPRPPVVVVTTATLQSICIALPSLNNPMMLVSSTSADWQLLATKALTCTNPARHAFEQTEFWKSARVQPGIVAQ
jgi:hypothetical protein